MKVDFTLSWNYAQAVKFMMRSFDWCNKRNIFRKELQL